MNRRFERTDAFSQKRAEVIPERVQTQNDSHELGDYARQIENKMRELGFDDVSIDPAGNVVGCLGSCAQSNRMIFIP